MNNYKICSGSTLKVIAVVTMIIDHVAGMILVDIPSCNEAIFSWWGGHLTVVNIMRGIGRWAFPIFAWLLIEGFTHTRNKIRYGLNLLVFALLSEIPYDLADVGRVGWECQNIFFTLLLGYIGLLLYDKWTKGVYEKILVTIMVACAALLLRVDYGPFGVIYICLLQLFVTKRLLQCISTVLLLPKGLVAALAYIPITLYNGKRGFICHAWTKYLFYAIYPLHLIFIYWINQEFL